MRSERSRPAHKKMRLGRKANVAPKRTLEIFLNCGFEASRHVGHKDRVRFGSVL